MQPYFSQAENKVMNVTKLILYYLDLLLLLFSSKFHKILHGLVHTIAHGLLACTVHL
jgi:hypothetical protein